MNKLLYIILFAFSITLGNDNVLANEVSYVSSFEVFVDSSNQLSVHDVFGIENGWVKKLEYAVKGRNVWYKVDLGAIEGGANNQISFLVDQPNIDSVSFYYQNELGVLKQVATGNDYSFYDRPVITNHFVFDLPENASGDYVYFKFRNRVKTNFNLLVGPRDTLMWYEGNFNSLLTFLIGCILVMVIYNLFLYFSFRESVYLVYVIQTLLVGLIQATLAGLSFQYLWPNSVGFQDISSELLTVMGTISGLIFMNMFLKLRTHVPVLYKASNVIITIYAALGISCFINEVVVNDVLLVGQGIIAIFILVTAALVIRKGYTPAKFYLLAWSTFLMGVFVYVLAENGVLERNATTALMMPIGSAIEVVLLSLALAYKVNGIKALQEKAVANSLRLEREKAQIIRTQNTQLELKVKERTVALEKTNSELERKHVQVEKALTDLKSAQSQLVHAEKMSSLGQLTAGIAHEINNPINFVSSNIIPLKRDIKDLLDYGEAIKSAVNATENEDLKQQIESYYQEYDIDFVEEEIEQLLAGMTDGAYRTVEIIRGLKLFSRVDEDDLKTVDLEEGLNSTLILLNSQLKHRFKVIKNFGEIPPVECFGGKMNQVFMNIISNAAQAILQNDPEATHGVIEITTRSIGENVELRFKDNGPGMTEEIKQRIFEPFFTTKPVGEGTGLGMSIVFKIIEKLNGTIELNSEVGVGTEFVITIPIVSTAKEVANA